MRNVNGQKCTAYNERVCCATFYFSKKILFSKKLTS